VFLEISNCSSLLWELFRAGDINLSVDESGTTWSQDLCNME